MRTSYFAAQRALLVLALLLVALPSFAADPQGTWELLDEDDGIKVWKNEIPGQELPGFRGEVTVDASLEAIVAQLQDNKHHPDWMYRCVESSIVKQIDSEHAVVYNRTTAPWPVWDRDVILDTTFSYNADRSILTLNFKNTDASLRPVPENVVRMPRLTGFYRMWRLAPSKTKILYEVQADVGGSIPRWLAKRVSKDLPYLTLSHLRERVLAASGATAKK